MQNRTPETFGGCLLLACIFVSLLALLLHVLVFATVVQQRRIYKQIENNIALLHILAITTAFVIYSYKLESHW